MLCAMQMAVRPASVSRRACAPAAVSVTVAAAVETACAASCKALKQVSEAKKLVSTNSH